MNTLQALRDGRNAVRQLEILTRERCLTDADAKRLITKALAGYDAALGPQEAASKDGRPWLSVIDGGLAQ